MPRLTFLMIAVLAVVSAVILTPVAQADEPSFLEVFLKLENGHFTVDRHAGRLTPSEKLSDAALDLGAVSDELLDDLDRYLGMLGKPACLEAREQVEACSLKCEKPALPEGEDCKKVADLLLLNATWDTAKQRFDEVIHQNALTNRLRLQMTKDFADLKISEETPLYRRSGGGEDDAFNGFAIVVDEDRDSFDKGRLIFDVANPVGEGSDSFKIRYRNGTSEDNAILDEAEIRRQLAPLNTGLWRRRKIEWHVRQIYERRGLASKIKAASAGESRVISITESARIVSIQMPAKEVQERNAANKILYLVLDSRDFKKVLRGDAKLREKDGFLILHYIDDLGYSRADLPYFNAIRFNGAILDLAALGFVVQHDITDPPEPTQELTGEDFFFDLVVQALPEKGAKRDDSEGNSEEEDNSEEVGTPDPGSGLGPSADLSVTVADGREAVDQGGSVTYTLVAENKGPDNDPAARLLGVFSAGLSCSYTSVASGGASNTAENGAERIDELLSLPAGSSVTYMVNCSVDSNAMGTLASTASIRSSVADPNSSNNHAMDDNAVDGDAGRQIADILAYSDRHAKPTTIGGGVEWRPDQGVNVFGFYRRRFADGAQDVILTGGLFGDAVGKVDYSADFLAFDKIHRPLSLRINTGIDQNAKRLFSGQEVDEERRRGQIRFGLEVFRNRRGQRLNLTAGLRQDDVKLFQSGDVVGEQDVSVLEVGLDYSRIVVASAHPWSFSVTPAVRIGVEIDGGEPEFELYTLDFKYHRFLSQWCEVDFHAQAGSGSDGTPIFEQPTLGGVDSLRGFRGDAAIARSAWSLQSELWVPLANGRFGGGKLRQFIARNVRLAVFADLGEARRSTFSPSGTRFGGGLGVRFDMKSKGIVLAIDWGYGLETPLDEEKEGKVYFSMRQNLR